MNTQLEQISKLFLNKAVSYQEVVAYLDILINASKNSEELVTIRQKLSNSSSPQGTERHLLVGILKNVNSLFRTYGKISDSLTSYIDNLK
ncbi:hypothetical protein GYA27_00695 [candidate division WWE3 bacterium]|uniref:Uncharacterized protein n=1 Tax=candidate division WWE3 bacterium TaxID=2053526 RepID=A0A7X9DK45_UNCKA|nr:hypothetical protein [candidate division WWE3 bacterium]